MKKVIPILMILLMVALSIMPSNAEDKPILEIFKENNKVIPDELIYDRTYYYGELKEYDLTDAFFFKAYTSSYALYEEELYSRVVNGTYSKWQYYAWVGDELLFIQSCGSIGSESFHFCIEKRTTIAETLWIQEIINSEIYKSEFHINDGSDYKIIICNGQDQMGAYHTDDVPSTALSGIQIVYIKDSCTIVSNYKDNGKKLTETTLTDYRKYFDDWELYLRGLSEEVRLSGNYMSINELLESNLKGNNSTIEPVDTEQIKPIPNNTVVPPETQDQLTQTPETTLQEFENSDESWLKVYGIYLAIGALVIAAALIVVVLRKICLFYRLL